MKKNNCTHPKKKVSGDYDYKNNVYTEHCIACGRKIYVRKFPKVGVK